MAVVYLHRRKDNNEVFYVGIGNDIKRAFDTKNRKNKHWKNIVTKYGYIVEIVEENLSWFDACIKEKELIKNYGRYDINEGTLVNMTDGGDGQSNPSEETRKKLKYKKTEEHKVKLRTYQLGVKQSEETIKKRINNGFHKTEEYRKKMSESLSGDKNPNKKEENKKKLRKPKSPRTKEHSQKISESKKGKPTWNKGIQLEKFICYVCGKEIGGKGNLSQHINKHKNYENRRTD
jgi:hypothetical protein